jgi:hypothetical protein
MPACHHPLSHPAGGPDDASLLDAIVAGPVKIPIGSMAAAAVPANRERTAIGVGEEVLLTASPGPIAWTLEGAGTLVPSGGCSATFRAGAPGLAVITAASPGGRGSLVFSVIQPTGVAVRRWEGASLTHTAGRPDFGFRGRIFLLPDEVSFAGLEIRRKSAQTAATGLFKIFDQLQYEPTGWFTMAECVAGQGTPAHAADQVYSGDPGGGPPFAPGTLTISMEWEYRVGGGGPQPLPPCVVQLEVDAKGKCSVSTGGAPGSAAPAGSA